MLREMGKRETKILDMLRGTEIFNKIKENNQDANDALACAAVCYMSTIGDIVGFQKEYINFIKKHGDSDSARKNPERATRVNIRRALKIYGEKGTIKAWRYVLNGKANESDFKTRVPTKLDATRHLRRPIQIDDLRN
jgi:hypothetical protein